MRTARTRRIAGTLATLWILPLLLGTVSAWAQSQGNLAQATKRTLLLFPFDAGSSVPGAAEVSATLSDVARSRLIASDAYTVVQFNKGLAPVARLHNDQQLSDVDVSPPFAESNTKGIKVTKLVGYDLAFVGSVDSYEYAVADKMATVTVSGRLLEVQTGKILKSATLSASSSKGGTAKEDERAIEAARNAGDKLMTQLVPVIVRDPIVPTKQKPAGKKRGGRNDWVWGFLAVAVGLGLGLSGGGHSGSSGGGGGGGGGGGSDLPPAPPR